MSVHYVYYCDCDDCYNNSMQNDDVHFYEIDIGNETAYKELRGKGNHICSDCATIMAHDYPSIIIDTTRELVYFDYSI